MKTAAEDDMIEVGVVVKPHGLRGEVRVHLHNPDSDAGLHPDALCLRSAEGCLAVLAAVAVAQGLRIRVEGVTDREGAEALRGARLEVRRDAILLQQGQYLYQDLIGCAVMEDHRCLGHVAQVFEAGSADVLVVRAGDYERMIPLVEPWVEGVDLGQRTIRVTDAEQWEATRIKG